MSDFSKRGASVAVRSKGITPSSRDVASLKDIASQNVHSHAKFQAYEMDVTQSGEVAYVGRSHCCDFSSNTPLSAVVNNAGIIKDALLLKMTEENFDDVIRVNLKGPLPYHKSIAKYMVENKVNNGSIVNISNGYIGQTNYAAAKGGLMSMTLTWAKELGSFAFLVSDKSSYVSGSLIEIT
ncbi:3-oxoacyl-[acyl-carrier-protein] reductase FabG-like, partial [Gigantopelta aegis]|uniref:3-oxoacyl-[acyl-carrier-protein] reductase FabG-like n=1 Tax=Gigantopelta aegis TaxID=1735272 RepID=UPI001B888192